MQIDLTQPLGQTFQSLSGDRTVKVISLAEGDQSGKYEVEVLQHIFPSRLGRKTYLSPQTLSDHYVTT